jgi:hypothetical protein
MTTGSENDDDGKSKPAEDVMNLVDQSRPMATPWGVLAEARVIQRDVAPLSRCRMAHMTICRILTRPLRTNLNNGSNCRAQETVLLLQRTIVPKGVTPWAVVINREKE